MVLIKRDKNRSNDLESEIKNVCVFFLLRFSRKMSQSKVCLFLLLNFNFQLKKAKIDMIKKQKDEAAHFAALMDLKKKELNDLRKQKAKDTRETHQLISENRKLVSMMSRKMKAHQKVKTYTIFDVSYSSLNRPPSGSHWLFFSDRGSTTTQQVSPC